MMEKYLIFVGGYWLFDNIFIKGVIAPRIKKNLEDFNVAMAGIPNFKEPTFWEKINSIYKRQVVGERRWAIISLIAGTLNTMLLWRALDDIRHISEWNTSSSIWPGVIVMILAISDWRIIKAFLKHSMLAIRLHKENRLNQKINRENKDMAEKSS